MEQARFKARTLDKSIFEAKKRTRSSHSDGKRSVERLQQVPFNLSTEQRGRQKAVKKTDDDTLETAQQLQRSKTFKAKKMPQYKFFEATKASEVNANARKDAEFAEFNLRTNSRSQSRVKRSLTGADDEAKQQSYVFKAAKMPDFSDTYHGIKPKSPKKLTTFTEFNLSTHNRGTDKQQKL